MASKKTSVENLAKEAGLDVDEVLLILWENGFSYVSGPKSSLTRGSTNRARRVLGLATRRELASLFYWEKKFQVRPEEFEVLLDKLGIAEKEYGKQLPKKAIRRFSAELRDKETQRKQKHSKEDLVSDKPKYPSFFWKTIGHVRSCRYLSSDEVKGIHFALVKDFERTQDPIDPPGVRDESLLESAVYRPHTAVDDVLKYPTIEMAAAALLHGIIHDHPFHNGNKRTGLVSMLVFLDENGLILSCHEDAIFKLVLQLAQHALVIGPRYELSDRETIAVAQWLKDCSRLLEKGDRALSWRRLKKILMQYDCKFSHPPGVGNRINISRYVKQRSGLFGLEREKIKKTQTFYGDEGREIEKNAINKIRKELCLDDDHGIDSRAFYENADITSSEFIIRYRKTLCRLAKL